MLLLFGWMFYYMQTEYLRLQREKKVPAPVEQPGSSPTGEPASPATAPRPTPEPTP